MFTAYIKGLNDMVFSTVSLQVISTLACLCYAERCMAVLKNKINLNEQETLTYIFFGSPACTPLLCPFRQFVLLSCYLNSAHIHRKYACLQIAATF